MYIVPVFHRVKSLFPYGAHITPVYPRPGLDISQGRHEGSQDFWLLHPDTFTLNSAASCCSSGTFISKSSVIDGSFDATDGVVDGRNPHVVNRDS